ncbi:SDO1-like protein C21C3.19 [Trametes pubescens]|uniref:SDO1-like protein C21C3.19 n=1 Tax=Trametes pubescens TaxID=154538 RepID=A0A1M2VCN6_TRAPU|nr:SDO1-like protein C21C3.19 [Trametes pubescens]
MGRELTKVVYKTDANEDFIVIVNPAEFKKWKEGGTTVPLTEVVDSFQVLWSNQGAQGLLGTPSNQQLDNAFGTHKDVDVITAILQKGKEETGKGIRSGEGTATNLTKGSFAVDTKGKGSNGI